MSSLVVSRHTGAQEGSQGHCGQGHAYTLVRVRGCVCVWGRSWLWVGRSGWVGSLGGVGSGRLSGWLWCGLVAVGQGLVWDGVKVGSSGRGRRD